MGMATRCNLLVIGGGPAGYVGAIEAARLGARNVVLVEKRARLGGVCLNEGCIPSKALIHLANLAWEARNSSRAGLKAQVSVDLARFQKWKTSVVRRLEAGIRKLLESRGVTVVRGRARFVAPDRVEVEGEQGEVVEFVFDAALLATGSSPVAVGPLKPGNGVVLDSAALLDIYKVPESIVVVGAGFVGLELGTAMAKLGARVVMVELLNKLFPSLPDDVGRLVAKSLKGLGIELRLESSVTGLEAGNAGGARVVVEDASGGRSVVDAELVALCAGRRPSVEGVNPEAAGIELTGKGYVKVDAAGLTSNPRVAAAGDLVGGAMLAHEAYMEAKRAVAALLGKELRVRVPVPAVVFTDPEVAWVGERVAAERLVRFPMAACGRAVAEGAQEGFVELGSDGRGRVCWGLAVGRGAGELVSQLSVAVAAGMDAEQFARGLRPHPTFSEAVGEAAELLELGETVHLPPGVGG